MTDSSHQNSFVEMMDSHHSSIEKSSEPRAQRMEKQNAFPHVAHMNRQTFQHFHSETAVHITTKAYRRRKPKNSLYMESAERIFLFQLFRLLIFNYCISLLCLRAQLKQERSRTLKIQALSVNTPDLKSTYHFLFFLKYILNR